MIDGSGTPWWRRRIPTPSVPPADVAASLALLALVLFLFRDAVFGGQVFYYRDIHLQWQPQVEAFVRAVTSGSWPLWNPDRSFGQPLLANPNAQVLYPPTWLNLLMRPWTYYTLYVAGHAFVCGLGVYLLALRLGTSRPGALLAASVAVSSGPFLSLASLWNHLAGAAWVPWIVLAADLALAAGGAARTVVWGLALAAPVLAGSVESGLIAAVLTVACCWPRLDRTPLLGSHNRRLAWTAVGAVALAMGFSAAQWLPSLELARRSARAGLPAAVTGYWSVHPFDLVETAMPLLLVDLPLRTEVRAALFESREPFMLSLYLGLTSVGLGVAAIGSGPSGRVARGLALTALVGVALALGRHAPLLEGLQAIFPPLRSLRYPAKAMILTGFAWALLVGLGFDEIARGVGRARRLLVPIVEATAAASLAVSGVALWVLRHRGQELGEAILAREFTRRPFSAVFEPAADRVLVLTTLLVALLGIHMIRRLLGSAYAPAIGLVVAFDLSGTHSRLTPMAERDLFTFVPPALASVKGMERSRLYVSDYFERGKGERYLGHPRFVPARLKEDWPFPWAEAVAVRAYLHPAVLGNWGLEAAYATDSLGLFPRDLELLVRLLRAVEGTPAHLRLLQVAGVERVVTLHSEGFESLPLVATHPTFFLEPMHVFRVPEPFPRTYAVSGVRVARGAAAAAVLRDPLFDPRREVILPEGPPTSGSPAFSASSRILAWRPDFVRLEAEASGPGHLVLLEGYDPGWHATVDGRPVPVLQANLGFRAVALSAGRHVVEYVYRPAAVIMGLALSAAAMAVALAAIVLAGAGSAS
ncbi:MAG: YfhO family protein [Acidobacteria bacterium]|nr:YfhO family protein [Acidobacteriota bacterium]